ncbi:MAG: 3-oxoacyl-[acyl-carrier-protein] reductase [Proteobacteria bacterium ST_bin15]|nr:MAG: 3-oxoacyl-[acyl-carrier-protein] reductase [Proteobacteria bacterium ST_bin15]
MFDLTGRRALITGATGGIGGAIAKALHGQGATCLISGTRQEKLDELASALGERVHVAACDLGDGAAVDALPDKAAELMGGLDLVIANAGITRDNIFIRLKDEDWETVMNVNLTSYFRLSRAASRIMLRQRFGRIVAITSVVGVTGNPGQGNYCASKAGMIGMSKALAYEVASRNITVNCVAPGFIETAMTGALNDKQKEAILGRVPARRLGSVDEIAAAVVYLCSNEAAYVTGSVLHVNGGMAMV